MATTIVYDRAEMVIGGQPYLDDGWIMNVRIQNSYNSDVAQGFSKTGDPTGIIEGNKKSTITWTEIFPDAKSFVDIEALCRNNPAIQAGQIIIQPTKLGGAPDAPAIVITNFTIQGLTSAAPGEGQTVTREVTIVGSAKTLAK